MSGWTFTGRRGLPSSNQRYDANLKGESQPTRVDLLFDAVRYAHNLHLRYFALSGFRL
jgi:hypothetical protein